jgi:transketolase C-terminal domain/subunit
MRYDGPSYMRIGKSDRHPVNKAALGSTKPYFARRGGHACLVAMGSMVAPCTAIAEQLELACVSVPRVKPLHPELPGMLAEFEKVIVVEEHSAAGGLASAILEQSAAEDGKPLPPLRSIALKERFTDKCGSYQYALSEHDLSDAQLARRIKALVEEKLTA